MDVPAKWKIKLPMDSLEEVAAFNEKLKMVTTDNDGMESHCRLELVYELNIFNKICFSCIHFAYPIGHRLLEVIMKCGLHNNYLNNWTTIN